MAQRELQFVLSLDDQMTRQLKRARTGLNRLSNKVKQAEQQSKTFAKGLTAVGAGLGFVGAKAVSTASDFEETRNRFDQVFGDLSEETREWAEEFSTAMGRSRRQVQDSLSSLQSFTIGMGFSQDQSAKLSKQLQQMITDFSSFNNLAEQDAQQRFISALSGSSEVVDRFGINLKQAALDQELLNLGFEKGAANASEMQKTLARFSIIKRTMGEQGAIGDAARTSRDFANVMRRLKAQAEDTLNALGQELLPMVKNAVQGLIGALRRAQDILPRLIQAFKEGHPAVSALAGAIIGGLVPALRAAAVAAGLFMRRLSPFIAIGAAVGLAVKKLKETFNISFGDIKNAVSSAMQVAENIINNVFIPALNFALPRIVDFAKGVFEIFKSMKNDIKAIFAVLGPIIATAWKAFVEITKTGSKLLLEVLGAFGNTVQGDWKGLWENLSGIVRTNTNFWAKLVASSMRSMVNTTNLFIDGMQKLGLNIENISTRIPDVVGQLGKTTTESEKFFDEVSFGNVKMNNLSSEVDKLQSKFEGMDNIIPSLINGMDGTGKAAGDASEATGEASSEMQEALSDLKDSANSVNKKIKSALEDTRSKIQEVQSKLRDARVERAKEQQSAQEKLASAFIDTEEKIAEMRRKIGKETDRQERQRMQERLKDLESEFQAKKPILEQTIGPEIEAERQRREQSILGKALGRFQKENQKAQENFKKEKERLKKKLENHKETEQKILELRAQAIQSSKKFVLDEEKLTIESINRQIEAYNQLAKAVKRAKQGITTSAASLKATEKAAENAETKVPELAQGGIVKGSSEGTLIKAGEKNKDEAIVPLDRGRSMGNVTVNIHWTGAVDDRAAERVGDKIIDKLSLNSRFSIADT